MEVLTTLLTDMMDNGSMIISSLVGNTISPPRVTTLGVFYLL